MFTPIGSTLPAPPPPGLFTVGSIAFDLTAKQGGNEVKNFQFSVPIKITMEYSDADVSGLNEEAFIPCFFNGTIWTAEGIKIIERDTANNRLVFEVNHLTEFALFQQAQIYLPIVLK